MRKNLSPMANAFLRLVNEADVNNTANDQLYQQKGKTKGEQKVNNAKIRERVRELLEEYDGELTVETLTTEDGLAQLKIQAPLIYEAFNSFYGQSKPKMPKAATPFRFGELTALLTDEHGKIKKGLIDKINSTGGFRLQSYSDFQIQNYTDVLQVIFEAGTLGLNGHAYTKVPAFLEATEGTNLKRNISIFMYKDGDEWKIDRNDSFPYTLDEIYDIVNADESGNTSIIAVSQNAEMSAWIMANDMVGYGIPFHKSGLKMGVVRDTIVKEDGREIKGYKGAIDHTKQQTEVWAKTNADHKANTKVKKGINIYEFWDFNNTENLTKNELIEKNVKAYIDKCEELGYLPKFRDYVMNNGKVLDNVLKYAKELGYAPQDATIDDISFEYKGYQIPYGYYKFLGDFGMFKPNGEASPIKTLSLSEYNFENAENFFANAEELRRNEILQQFSNGEERQKYRDSDMTAEQLADVVRQKRQEVVDEIAPRYSLGDEVIPKGDYNVYGKDIALETAPVQEVVQEEATDEYAPITDESEMPDEVDAPTRQYEAIEPRPQNLDAQEQEWANNKMARVKDPKKATPHNVDAKMRSWAETSTESEVVNREILPDDLDLSKIVYEPIPNRVTLSNANAKLGTLGYDDALTYFNSQLAGKKATLDDIALGERLLQESMKKGDKVTAGELIQNIAILGTELGQKVQALSIIQRLTPEGQLKMLHKTINRGKVKGDKAFEGVELTQEMIDHILKTYKADGTFDQNELNKAVEDVKTKIAKQMKVTKIDKVNAWRHLAMLGNPKTHIRNLVSNVAMKGTVGVKNAVARTIEDIAPIEERTKTWKRATDDVKAFAEATTLEMKDVITEDTKYSEEASIKSKRDMFKNNILNKVYEFNNDLMTKEDWWFSKPAYKNSLSEYLTVNGIKTSKDIENNPKIVEKAKQYALEQSQIATFRQYSWLANKIREVERKNTATEIAVGSILPFKKTPVNIAKAGLSYSPIGLFAKLPYDLYQMKQGKKQASEVVDTFAQGLTGSALTLAGYMLAMSGLLSGGGDDDKEGKYDYQLGEQAYSLNFGGNTYSLSWLSPVAMPLFVGANAYEQLVEGEEWNGNVVMETLAQTLDPLSEMSFLSSLDSVLSSYDSGVEKFAGIGKSMLQNYVTQFIPTLSSQLATVMDDKKRSTKVAGDSEFELVDETINKLIYKIPFLRETLEPTTDIWGNEVKQSENMIERALETFIAPYSRKESIATEIDAEIKDLYAQTGDNGIIPNIPYNYVNYDGEKYNMSAKEYTEFKKTYGQTANEMLEDLFNTTTYQNATSEDKAELVNKVYDYARDEAKREYLDKEGVEYTNATQGNTEYYKENPIKGAIDNDMTLEEFDMFSKTPERYYVAKAVGGFDAYTSVKKAFDDLEADKDENGNSINGSRKKKIIEYINTTNLDYGAKLVMFKSVYNGDDTYNREIIEYLNSRTDITYEEEIAILKELGFTVDANGTIRW
jgi:hypothetical protein